MKVTKNSDNQEIRIPLSTIKIIYSGQILPDEVAIYIIYKKHFSLPEEDTSVEFQPITNNPHKTNEVEATGIQSRIKDLVGEETYSKNPGILDGLLIDIGVYPKRSKEILTTKKNGEPTISQK